MRYARPPIKGCGCSIGRKKTLTSTHIVEKAAPMNKDVFFPNRIKSSPKQLAQLSKNICSHVPG
jgi:hypothetical protein